MTTPEQTSEILILPDGTIYVHNLTREIAQLLQLLNPDDLQLKQRYLTQFAEPPEPTSLNTSLPL
ncbi:MAG: hypothetical protein WCO60_15145 [Verrucomicrobiota bacterium]